MKLIDADRLLESLESNIYPEKYGNSCNPMDIIHGVLQVINEQPTAYDVDKVLNEANERRGKMIDANYPSRFIREYGYFEGLVVKGGTAGEEALYNSYKRNQSEAK